MFQVQTVLLEVLPTANALNAKYNPPADGEIGNKKLDAFEAKARHFIVRTPVVGGFSVGKSRLLNAFAHHADDEPLFSTEVTPETAVPAELGYGKKESFIGRYADGRTIALSRKQVRDNDLAVLQPKSDTDPSSWVEVSLNIPQLAQIPHIRIVDMPGWNSNAQAHNRAIDDYLANSLAYCVAISAEEGTVREDIRKVLDELKLHDMPVVAVVTKAEKRTPEDIDAIKVKVAEELQAILGKPPLRTIAVSAVSKRIGVGEFTQALLELEGMAEPVFQRAIIGPWLERMGNLKKRLETLCNGADMESESIQAKLQTAQQSFERFNTELQNQTDGLESRLDVVLGNIADRIISGLNVQLTSLTNTAANGGEIGTVVNDAVRLAVTKGLDEDFKPEVQRYLRNVESVVPSDVVVDLSLTIPSTSRNSVNTDDFDWQKGALAALPVLVAIPVFGPITAGIVGVIGLFLGHAFSGKSSTPHVDPEAARREHIRSQLANNIIPKVGQDVSAQLRPKLQKRIEDAKNAIKESVKSEQANHEKTLVRLQTELEQGQAEFDKKKTIYQADLNTINELVNQVKNA
jgi:hypothetical protein